MTGGHRRWVAPPRQGTPPAGRWRGGPANAGPGRSGGSSADRRAGSVLDVAQRHARIQGPTSPSCGAGCADRSACPSRPGGRAGARFGPPRGGPSRRPATDSSSGPSLRPPSAASIARTVLGPGAASPMRGPCRPPQAPGGTLDPEVGHVDRARLRDPQPVQHEQASQGMVASRACLGGGQKPGCFLPVQPQWLRVAGDRGSADVGDGERGSAASRRRSGRSPAKAASPVLRTCGCVGLIGLELIEPWLSCCAGVAWGLQASRGASTPTPTSPAARPLRPAQRGEAARGPAGGGRLLPAS
jgi:hypothetical protein